MDEPVQEYEYGPGWRVTEIAPTHCPRGHEWGPGQVQVGFERGEGDDRGKQYRTYLCLECVDAGQDTAMRFLLVEPRMDGPW